METLVVVSKVKKFIKQAGDLNTSSNFCDELSEFVANECREAIEKSKKSKRKTVLGRDVNSNATDDSTENIDSVLVVASKVKKFIKDESGLNTSAQVMPQLTLKVQNAAVAAINHAKSQGRKTVLDRDLSSL